MPARVSDRPPHRDRLALSADGVGEVNNARDEERHGQAGAQRGFEARHGRRGDRAPRESDQQPGQAVAHAAQRRILDGVARLRGLALDAGETGRRPLNVLAAQHLQQRLRGA